jgi:hypothetical protein
MTNPARPTLVWTKSSACAGTANCVEVAPLPDSGFAVRDSKDPQGPDLRFNRSGWVGFLSSARAGEFAPQAGER